MTDDPAPTSALATETTTTTRGSVTVVSGGVGAARFLSGLVRAVEDPGSITAIVNTGDDCVMHGLSISPDLDTVTYTLADAIDPIRGWGLVDESWRVMESLGRYDAIKPSGSSAATRWFNLGDRDLATHLYRTARRAEGGRLTDITDEIRRAWNVPVRILPMSDDPLSTSVTTTDHGEISFQDYFVRLRHDVDVSAVHFTGAATLTDEARRALDTAEVVVIAPSNPLVSIAPIRHLGGVDDTLTRRRDRVVAVSPIVGGAALKGPAARMMTGLGHEPTVVGVARLYAPIASALVIDPIDAIHASAVESAGMRCIVQPSVMSTPQIARELAEATIAAIR
jgi:LPPG:FO 2-phospho-L-lactate transferase